MVLTLRLYLKCYGPSVTSVSVTKAGLAGTGQRDGRGRTMRQGLSKSRGSVQYMSTRVRWYATDLRTNGPTYQRVFHRSKDLYLRIVSPYYR
jgi:hypothetical protein